MRKNPQLAPRALRPRRSGPVSAAKPAPGMTTEAQFPGKGGRIIARKFVAPHPGITILGAHAATRDVVIVAVERNSKRASGLLISMFMDG